MPGKAAGYVLAPLQGGAYRGPRSESEEGRREAAHVIGFGVSQEPEKSKQARKRYKVTSAGKTEVNRMLSGKPEA